EPGTSYAYPRQIERKQGRVKTLAPDGKQSFDLEYQVLTTSDDVKTVDTEIQSITSGQPTKVINQPIAKE
ncbi:MAG TPA: hypothetical protein VN809_00930, partial [Telmatospirillum sp.]|nr:hypothetical protein [Telmatospirillum sp.]